MAATYSYPGNTINTDSLTFRINKSAPLGFEDIDGNHAYLHNLSLAGGAGSSKVIYRAKSSEFEEFGGMDAAEGEFGVQIVNVDDDGNPLQAVIYFNNSDLWGNKTNFWSQQNSDTIEEINYGDAIDGGIEPDPVINQVCGNCFAWAGNPLYDPVTGIYTVLCRCICPLICGSQKYYTLAIKDDFKPDQYWRSYPKPKKLLRVSRISGTNSTEQTFTFTVDGIISDNGGITAVVVSPPPSNGGDIVNACPLFACKCKNSKGYNVLYGGYVRCCWLQNCQNLCNATWGECPDSTGPSATLPPTEQPSLIQASSSPCTSCAKKSVSVQNTFQLDNAFMEAGVAYSISIVDSSPREYNQSLSTSVNNSLIYTGENQIYPAIDATPSSGYSSTAFTHGRFNSALTKFTSFTSSYTFSSSFTASVNGTTSWPKYGLTSSQFDYNPIMTPHPSSGISAVGRYYYQLAIDRTHPNGSFNSMLTNLDAGYRVNLNFQLASASIVSPTYSGPKNFSTVLHDYSTLTGSIVNVIMSSTFSLPSLVRNSRATMSYNGTRIFTPGNKFQLSFNEFSTPTTSTYSTLENSFWQPLLQSTSDKILTIQQVGASNYWKFRISGSSSKVKTKSRAIAQGKNTFEYILSDAYLLPSNIYRPGVLSKLPTTFPSNVQYNISYANYINPGFGQVSFDLRESSIFATASTYSVYLTEPLEEGEMVIKRVSMTSLTSQILGTTSPPLTQFGNTYHLLVDSITASATMSQTFVAFRPTWGGETMTWYRELENYLLKSGSNVINNDDGSTTIQTKGKPQLVRLNINNCPDCPDGNTVEFHLSSITKLVTGEIIIGNEVWWEYRDLGGGQVEACMYESTNLSGSGSGVMELIDQKFCIIEQHGGAIA